MWRFLDLAEPVINHVDDSNDSVGDVFRLACEDLGTIAVRAGPDVVRAPDRGANEALERAPQKPKRSSQAHKPSTISGQPQFWRKLLPVRGLAHLWLIPILAHCVDADGRPVRGAPPPGPHTNLARFNADQEIPGAVAAIREFWAPTRYNHHS